MALVYNGFKLIFKSQEQTLQFLGGPEVQETFKAFEEKRELDFSKFQKWSETLLIPETDDLFSGDIFSRSPFGRADHLFM